MNQSQTQFPMQNLTHTTLTERAELTKDLEFFATPQELRKVLQQSDQLESARVTDKLNGYATAFTALAASTALAPIPIG